MSAINREKFDVREKLTDSKDNLQIQYLQDLKYGKNEILIIESNPTLALTLQKYLMRLGFQNIYQCKTGKEGIETFSKLIESGKTIPVIVDDSISDKNVKEVIRELFQIDSGAIIIIETVNDRSELVMKEILNLGVFSLLTKPLRFNDLKELAEMLEKEHETDEDKIINLQNKIKFILKRNKKISFKRISEFADDEIHFVNEYLKNLEIHDQIKPLVSINEIACNQCNSVRINLTSKCPQCNGINFVQQNLVEHYKCGEVYPKESNIEHCPKCNKDLGRMGVDYGELDNYYICSGCDNKFPEPQYEYECRNCEGKFTKHQAHWIKSMNYEISKL